MGSIRALLGALGVCHLGPLSHPGPFLCHLSLPPAHYNGTEPWETELEEIIPLLKMSCQGSGHRNAILTYLGRKKESYLPGCPAQQHLHHPSSGKVECYPFRKTLNNRALVQRSDAVIWEGMEFVPARLWPSLTLSAAPVLRDRSP